MVGAAVSFSLCYLGVVVVSAWPKQSEAEIAEEAARDALIYEQMKRYAQMQPTVIGDRLKADMGYRITRRTEGECKVCPNGQFFHSCNVAGEAGGIEYTCKTASDYLHGGSSDKECKDIQTLAAKCCNTTAPPPTGETCDAPAIPKPNCTAHQKSLQCMDGYRAADDCVRSWVYNGKQYDGCKVDGDSAWCSHHEHYTFGSWDYSNCEPCREEVDPREPQAKWEPIFESFRCVYAIATAGDSKRRVLTFENGGPAMDNLFPAFSSGKWVATVAIAGVINEGHLTWDSKASEVFDWWTKDAADPRSRVTLHHLLNFLDGFVNIEGISQFTHDPVAQRCLTPGFANWYTPEQCAKQIYETAHFAGVGQDTYMNATNPGAEPGTWFDYNSYHQQIALGMATKVTGMDARDLLKKYVLDPAGMKQSYWLGGSNPCLSGFLQTTANEYDGFLRNHIAYKLIPKPIADRTETIVLGTHGSKAPKQFGTNNMVKFENFAMGLMHVGDKLQMGGNIGDLMDRTTGHYATMIYAGRAPYHFQELSLINDFDAEVEKVWNSANKVQETIAI